MKARPSEDGWQAAPDRSLGAARRMRGYPPPVSRLAAAHGIGALLIVDLNGTSLYMSGNAWIKRVPDPVFGREASTRTWTFEVDELRDFTGGNL